MQDNKLIAEFMGVVFHDDENQYYNADGLHIGNTLQYYTSWDWLMPVIEKILDNAFYDVGLTSMEDFYSIKTHIPYMDETYQAVVDFIKTYNDER